MKKIRRLCISFVLCMAVIITSFSVMHKDVQAKTYQLQFIPEGVYNLFSVANPKLCIDLKDSSNKDGAITQLWTNQNTNNQRFKFIASENGWYYIQVMSSQKYLDLDSQNVTGNGAKVQQYYFHGGYNQQWGFMQAGTGPNGGVYIVNRAAYENKRFQVLTIQDNITSTGTAVWSYELKENNWQTWVFAPTKSGEIWTPLIMNKDTKTFETRYQTKNSFPYRYIRVISYADLRFQEKTAPDLKIRIVKGTSNNLYTLTGSKYRWAYSSAYSLLNNASKKFVVSAKKQTGGYYMLVGVK